MGTQAPNRDGPDIGLDIPVFGPHIWSDAQYPAGYPAEYLVYGYIIPTFWIPGTRYPARSLFCFRSEKVTGPNIHIRLDTGYTGSAGDSLEPQPRGKNSPKMKNYYIKLYPDSNPHCGRPLESVSAWMQHSADPGSGLEHVQILDLDYTEHKHSAPLLYFIYIAPDIRPIPNFYFKLIVFNS